MSVSSSSATNAYGSQSYGGYPAEEKETNVTVEDVSVQIRGGIPSTQTEYEGVEVVNSPQHQ